MIREYEPICPKCKSVMLLRTRQADGLQFYGCSKFPACTETMSVKQVERKVARLSLDEEYKLRWSEKMRKHLKKPNYYAYLQSDQWKQKKREMEQSARYRCQVCNRDKYHTQLNIHHRTYERLGHELPSDLVVLCKDCHALYHGKLPDPLLEAS